MLQLLKDSALVKVNADLMHIEREKDSLSAEVSGRKQELEATRQLLESQRADEKWARGEGGKSIKFHSLIGNYVRFYQKPVQNAQDKRKSWRK